MSIRPFVTGANYQTCPSGLRDKLFLDPEERRLLRQKLKADGLDQILIISTCDRVEFFGCHHQPEEICSRIQTYLIEHAPSAKSQAATVFFRRLDEDAVSHLFYICTALHSQMIGESQILGQMKEAYSASQKENCMGPDLDQLMQSAFNLAKRVRSQTKIGEGAVSVASAGAKLARDLHGDLEECRGMLYGLGEAGQILLDQFKVSGMENWTLSGSARRTERYAARLHCHYLPETDIPAQLKNCDILITASGLGRFLLDPESFAKIMAARRYKPLLIIDCGIPQDIDPAIDDIDGIFRYELEDLERLAERGQTNREAEAEQARRMVLDGVMEYRRQQAEKDGIPALIGLREHFDKTRQTVLQENPHLDATEITRLLINKLLHLPSEALRQMAAEGSDADLKDWITVNRVLEQLFHISDQSDNDKINMPEGDAHELDI